MTRFATASAFTKSADGAPPDDPSTAEASGAPAASSATSDEGSLLGRFVALFTPVFAILAGWFAGVIAMHVPGARLDPTQVTTFMVAAATTALTTGVKWLHGWQKHESLVAQGKATACKPRTTTDRQRPRRPRLLARSALTAAEQ
jgi:hypothetical protein